MIDVGMIEAFTFSMLLSLAVPVCGYMGAKKRDKRLIGCFTCCNGLTMCWWFVMIILCFFALGISTADIGDGYNLQYYVNEGMPVLQSCCAELKKDEYAANGQSPCSKPLGSIVLDVYSLASDPRKEGVCQEDKDGDAASVGAILRQGPEFRAKDHVFHTKK